MENVILHLELFEVKIARECLKFTLIRFIHPVEERQQVPSGCRNSEELPVIDLCVWAALRRDCTCTKLLYLLFMYQNHHGKWSVT